MDAPAALTPRKGQPPKIEQEDVLNRLWQALGKGATYRIACGFAKISYETFRTWVKRAEGALHLHEEELENHPDKVYVEFYAQLKYVEGYAALKWLEKIEDASRTHWQAAAWKLERRYPEQYGRFEKEIKEDADTTLEKARDEVAKLKGDDHGRSSSAKG